MKSQLRCGDFRRRSIVERGCDRSSAHSTTVIILHRACPNQSGNQLSQSGPCWTIRYTVGTHFWSVQLVLYHMSKQPPLADYVTVAAAAEWLTDGDRRVNSEDLLSLALERKLVLSLEFIDPWPASRVEIMYLTPDDVAETFRKVRKSATDNQDLPVEPINYDSPRARIIFDGPTLSDSEPPSRAIYLRRTGEIDFIENVGDLFLDSTAKLVLKNAKRKRNEPQPGDNNNGLIVTIEDAAFELMAKPENDEWPYPLLASIPPDVELVVRTGNLVEFSKTLPLRNQSTTSDVPTKRTKQELRKLRTAERDAELYKQYKQIRKKLKKERPKKKVSDLDVCKQILQDPPDGADDLKPERIRRIVSELKKK